jgi:hypothetical protein
VGDATRRIPALSQVCKHALTDLAQRVQQRGSIRVRKFVDERLVHDPGVDDQGAVDERGSRIGQADHDCAGVILCLTASQQTAHDAAMVP